MSDNTGRHIPIAIVAMQCRLPGAPNIKAYWDLLHQGRCSIAEIPPEMLDRERYYDPRVGEVGKTYTTLAGLLGDRETDLERLGLQPEHRQTYDAAHLMLAEVAHDALAQLGDPFQVAAPRAGVYIGATNGSPRGSLVIFATLVEETAAYLREIPLFQDLPRERQDELIEAAVTQVRSRYGERPRGVEWKSHMAAWLISQLFHLEGPSFILDAACASSLQALLLGMRALQQGQIDMAVVGGCSWYRPDRLVLFSYAQSVSARGSFPFDSEADGLVVGEGCAIVVLKTLERALADGDPIRAVIQGAGMSTDGKGKSLWAPRREGQILAMQRAYQQPREMQKLGYIEAHATSTQVGDATELMALQSVLAGHGNGPVAVGSCKGNLGHCLEAAGLAGLLKAVLALEHESIPPAPHVNQLNPCLDWKKAAIYIPREATPWPRQEGRARRAAVNSFGVGGLNVHVVLEEAPSQTSAPSIEPVVFPEGEPIAVVGTGTILPGADNVEQFWKLMQEGKSALSEVPPERWDRQSGYRPGSPQRWKSNGTQGGFIRHYQYDWRKNKVPPKQVAQANPLQFQLLDAVAQALKQAGYDHREFDRSRVGVVVGTVFAGDFQHRLQMTLRLPEFQALLEPLLLERGFSPEQTQTALDQYRELLFQKNPALLDETGSFTSSTLASRISKAFNIQGGAFSLDADLHSGLAALHCATQLLRSGDCEMMICAGAQRWMDLAAFDDFSHRGWMERGIVPGEGAGVLLLKTLSRAQRDGDTVLAVVRQTLARSDWQGGQGAQKAIEEATFGATVAAIQTGLGLTEQIGLGAGTASAALVKCALACQSLTLPTPQGPQTLKEDDCLLVTSDPSGPIGYVAVLQPPPPCLPRPKARLAWMFVGQGAQYQGMLKPLVEQFSPAREALARADEALARSGCPSFAQLAWEDSHRLGVDVEETQLATLIADYILAQSLEALGLKPDVVAGHSFGEIAALVTAGAWDLDTAILCVRRRAEALQHLEERGGMVALSGPRERVEELLARASEHGRIYLANQNSPQQFAISGQETPLAVLLELAREANLNAVRLPVPCAFHSPLMAPAQEAFSLRHQEIPLRPARIPVLSTAYPTYMMEVEDIQRSLCEQFCQPVRYTEMVEKLAQDHPTVFLEVGPQKILTRLHQKTLDASLIEAVASDDPKQPGLDPLLAARQRLLAYLDGPHQEAAAGPQLPGRVFSFDATARRRKRNRGGLELDEDSQDLKDFLIGFIVEQTGYPPEMVDLDSDLEAELGIDSIKKAQMLGEVRERFPITPPSGGVSLDDFLTLRSILDFLAKLRQEGPLTRATSLRQATRQVLRLIPAPPPVEVANFLPQRAFLLGSNPYAEALARQLRHEGWVAVQGGIPELEAALEQGPLSHLFLLSSYDNTPEGDPKEALLLPFLACQKWHAGLGADTQARLLVVANLGGDLGLSGHFTSSAGGGLAGLAKALMRESEGRVAANIFDFLPSLGPTEVAHQIVTELKGLAPDREVAWGPERAVLRELAQPPLGRSHHIPQGTWLVTGGGRGITAFVARQLARRYGLKLHLVGRRALPQLDPAWLTASPEEWKEIKTQLAQEARQQGLAPDQVTRQREQDLELVRALNAYQEDNIEFEYHRCDVRQFEEVEALLKQIGPIQGVLHGAGWESAAGFQAKQREHVELTLASKVDGALHLMSALDQNPPHHFINFGSISGRLGGVGQTDYSMANEMLSKLTAWYRRRHPQCTALCMVWPAWAEIGMAARPESRLALEARNVFIMPPGEGVEHLIRELESSCEDCEVVLYDHLLQAVSPPALSSSPKEVLLAHLYAQADCYPYASSPAAVDFPDRTDLASWLGVSPLCVARYLHRPLLDPHTSQITLNPQSDPFLVDHQAYGRAVLPGVVSAEALLEIANRHQPCQELTQLRWRTRLELDQPMQLSGQLSSDGICQILQVSGEVVASAVPEFTLSPRPAWEPLPADIEWNDFVYPKNLTLVHGPSLQTLKRMRRQGQGFLAELVAPHPQELRAGHWLVPAALLDGCLMACGTQAFLAHQGRVELPLGMERLVVHSIPGQGEVCRLSCQVLDQDETGSRYRFRLMGAEGQALLEVEGYQTMRLKQGSTE